MANGTVNAYNTVANGTVGAFNDAKNATLTTADQLLGTNLTGAANGAELLALPLALALPALASLLFA